MASTTDDTPTPNGRVAAWALGIGAVVVLSPLVVLPCVQAMALHLPPRETGSPAIDAFDVYFCSFVLLVPIAAILALAYATQRGCATGCALGVVSAFLFVGAFLGGDMIADTVRMRAFGSLAERSRPLIAAIDAYQQDHETPPGRLCELVPKYLPDVPATGLEVYPSYGYVVGDKASRGHGGNPWALVVKTPKGWGVDDQFVYYPLGNYPEGYYDYVVERVGDWAYLHYSD